MANIEVYKAQASTTSGPKEVYVVEYTPNEGPSQTFTTPSKRDAVANWMEKTMQHPPGEPLTQNGQPPDHYPFDEPGLSDPSEYDRERNRSRTSASNPINSSIPPERFGDDTEPYRPGMSARPPTPGTVGSSSNISKKARDLNGLSSERKKQFLKLTEQQLAERGINGAFGTRRIQAMCKRETAPSEKVIGRGVDNNAFIVIGNDRPGKLHEGYGGKGHTQCDSIDICVGMGGTSPQETEKVKIPQPDGTEKEVEKANTHNPNFFVDAARIYISQKTDVDKNFGIGEFGPKSPREMRSEDPNDIGRFGAKSAIALKADNIRLISRESMRFVSGTDKLNSAGGTVYGKSGIELIAMNKIEELQPLVLGDNLVEFLDKLIDRVDALGKIMHGYLKYQMKFNVAIGSHTHVTKFFAKPTLPSRELESALRVVNGEHAMRTEMSILKNSTNMVGLRMNYLTESGFAFINSPLNKTN